MQRVECLHSSTVDLSVRLVSKRHDEMLLYEVQAAKADDHTPDTTTPFLATTTTNTSLNLKDLHPNTSYVLRARANRRKTRRWTELSQAVTCTTLALQKGQPHLLPPTEAPKTDAVALRIEPTLLPSGAPVYVQLRSADKPAWSAPRLFANTTGWLEGLAPATTYEVRALLTPGGVPSDAVEYRTLDAASKLTAYRIAELCSDDPRPSYTYEEPPEPCQPDYLRNHDAGDLLADVEFATLTAGSFFDPQFNGSVLARYCVEYTLPDRFADYVSCNGVDTEHYECACNNFIDRCIGRLPIDSCHFAPQEAHLFDNVSCECTAESLAHSARVVGRMPVYYPFPQFHNRSHSSSPSCHVEPAESSSFMGHWYSLPAAAECATGSRVPTGGASCSWSRSRRSYFAHGFELAEAGFELLDGSHGGGTVDILSLLERNSLVVSGVFASRVSRCCGC